MATAPALAAVSPTAPVVINEVYGGGGNSGGAYNRDFVELRNTSADPVDVTGWAVQYASSGGDTWQVTELTGTIAAGDTLLIGMAFGNDSSQPAFEADIEGSTAMSGSRGKVALTDSSAALACATDCATQASVVDLVGYGSASSYAGSGPAPGTSNSTSVSRDEAGTNTADNAADFTAGAPSPQPSAGGTTPPGGLSPDAPVVINEVYGGAGRPNAVLNRDFIELRNTSDAPVSVDGWAVQVAFARGTGWNVTELSGTIQPGDTLLIGMDQVGEPADFEVDIEGATDVIAWKGRVALTDSTTALTCGQDCAEQPGVIDLLGYGEDAASYAGSAPSIGGNPTRSLGRDAAGTNTVDNAADFSRMRPTPQAGAGEPEPEITTIAEIQGTGDASPLVGAQVTTRGIVTAVYATGGRNGYVIQTPGTGGSDIPEASEAVFVFSRDTMGDVAAGQFVQVTGEVVEYYGLTEVSVTSGGLTVLEDDAEAVTPTAVGWPRTDAERERLESMLLAPQGDFTVTNTYSTSQYGEVGLAAGTTPLWQPTDVADAGSSEAAAVEADNAARGVVLDDGATINFTSSSNRDLTPPYVSLTDPVRVGAPVTFTQPVILTWSFDLWRFDPTTHLVAGQDAPATFANTRTAQPDAAAIGEADFTVASFNVLNYFTTLGVDNASCEPYTDRDGNGTNVRTGCPQRGAWDAVSLQRQQDKLVAAITATDADITGLMEIENSVVLGEEVDEAVATLTAALNAAAGEEKWAYVPSSADLPEASEMDVITNALIYQVDAVQTVGEAIALGDQSGEGQAFSNAREPIGQTFAPVGGGEEITVVVNHFKSKGTSGATGVNADQGDGQGAWNAARTAQASALVTWVGEQTQEGDAVALIGDFNSYTQEDPMQVFYDAGYVNATTAFEVANASYSYSGLSGSLDHVLLNPAALERATGADIWDINAGESVALEYSRYNNHGTLFYDASPYRSSDHDPVIVGLGSGQVTPPEPTGVASEIEVWMSQVSFSRTQWFPIFVYAAVRIEDGSSPQGVVEIREGERVVTTLPVGRGGTTGTWIWPGAFTQGEHELIAVFVPTSQEIAGSTSWAVPISVR